jgi:hypothetical protein
MIDWFGVFRNALWICGLALALAAFSYADWRRRVQAPRQSLGRALEGPWFRAAFSLGLTLVCAGLALGGGPWWAVALWAGLGLLCLGQGLAALAAARRQAESGQVPAPGDNGDQSSGAGPSSG